MLNLWEMFGPEQYLTWADNSIEEYKTKLMTGKINDVLDDFDDITEEDYESERWTLRKAIWHKVNYTRFPGLIRLAWSMYKNALRSFTHDGHGAPVFRIPIPGGYRGYFRVDLRKHDVDGNFTPEGNPNELTLDEYGNIWIHPEIIEGFLKVKGGADLDDSAGIIPVEDGRAVIYRNPNQYGEFGIYKIRYEGIRTSSPQKLIGIIPQKEITGNSEYNSPSSTGNNLLDSYLKNKVHITKEFLQEYNTTSLLKTYTQISKNNSNIGLAANAEMVKTSVGIIDNELFQLLSKEFTWNLENIIDSAKKEGTGAEEDMLSVQAMFDFLVEGEIPVPKVLLGRLPEKLRSMAMIEENHPLDELIDAIEFLIKKTDKEILGEGSASRGNRIPGLIDNLDIPLIEIGRANLDNCLFELSIDMMKNYNKQIAIMLESTKKMKDGKKEIVRKGQIENIQKTLLNKLTKYSNDERSLIVQCWAYEIYKTNRSVHDSILWISDTDDLIGTSGDMIQMLSNLELADKISCEENILIRDSRSYSPVTDLQNVRVWRKEQIDQEKIEKSGELIVEDKLAMFNKALFNVGDECKIPNGKYLVKDAVTSRSRKNQNAFLKNSLTLYLQITN